MNFSGISSVDRKRKWGIAGVIVSAVAASICCTGPLILLALGVGGASVGSLTAFEAYRPFMSLLTMGFLGYAFYRVYRQPQEPCDSGSDCSTPAKDRMTKITLWTVTVLAASLLAFPYLAPELANAGQKQAATDMRTEEAVLEISAMTCGGCALTVQQSLLAVNGVIGAKVTYQPPRAVVTYQPDKVILSDLTNATAQAGYPAKITNNTDDPN